MTSQCSTTCICINVMSKTRRCHSPIAHTPFPLNLNFGDLNATNSKINTILAIFRVFSIIWKVFRSVGGKGVWAVGGWPLLLRIRAAQILLIQWNFLLILKIRDPFLASVPGFIIVSSPGYWTRITIWEWAYSGKRFGASGWERGPFGLLVESWRFLVQPRAKLALIPIF